MVGTNDILIPINYLENLEPDTKSGDIYEVENFVIHPGYSYHHTLNDIAIVNLKRYMKY